jgi:hypothetical protein
MKKTAEERVALFVVVGLYSLSALVLISNSQIYSPENVSQSIGVGDQESLCMPNYWPT